MDAWREGEGGMGWGKEDGHESAFCCRDGEIGYIDREEVGGCWVVAG